jgi:carboxyl-terminal processing protease
MSWFDSRSPRLVPPFPLPHFTPRVLGAIAFAAGAALASGAWVIRPAPAAAPGASAYAKARVFEEALTLLRAHAVDTLNEGDLYLRATEGVVKSLHDPWAALLVGDGYGRFKAQLDGMTSGVGLEVETRGGRVVVAGTATGSPAEQAGLMGGDWVVTLNDSTTEGWSGERAMAALRGPEGSPVKLTLMRPGTREPYAVTLIRAPVHQPAVRRGLMVGDSIGYLAVTAMTARASDELTRQIDALVAQGARGLVLDFRGNPGGLVQEGARIAELFLDPGQTVATMKGRELEVFQATDPQRWPSLPVVVLVDGGTASAAEVASAALQDHDRAILLGTPTFGKGVVQRTYALADDVALRFTTARWYAPSGRWIQRGSKPLRAGYPSDGGRILQAGAGIVPDTVVTAAIPTDAERAYGIAVSRNRDEYEEALSVIAAHLVRAGAVSTDSTPVTPRMRAMLFQRLQGSGLRISDTLFAQARMAVDRDLGVMMVRGAFGTAAALRRQIAYDRQVQVARELLRQYPTSHAALSLETAGLGTLVATATE